MGRKKHLTKGQRSILTAILDRQREEQKRLERIAVSRAYSDHDLIEQHGRVDGLRLAAGALLEYFGV